MESFQAELTLAKTNATAIAGDLYISEGKVIIDGSGNDQISDSAKVTVGSEFNLGRLEVNQSETIGSLELGTGRVDIADLVTQTRIKPLQLLQLHPHHCPNNPTIHRTYPDHVVQVNYGQR